jgi:curved DNA-binding protein CbpA
MKDYYSLLGLSKDANTDEIKNAFMIQALKWHPDKAHNAEEQKEFSKVYNKLREAYKILSNKESRRQYLDSQQSTIEDFRSVDRDIGYQDTDQFKNLTEDGMVFDSEKFSEAFHSSRSKKDQEALEKLQRNTKEEVCTDIDYMELLKRREQDTDQFRAEIPNLFEGQQEVDMAQFNRAFDFMKAQQEETSVQEYYSEPTGFFSTGGLVEDDRVAGIKMNNGTTFDSGNMDQMVSGISHQPGRKFDISQFSKDAYGEEKPMSESEIHRRMEMVQQDRDRLANLDKSQFKNEATEIEKMYSGLFEPAEIEGLDAPIGLESTKTEEVSKPKSRIKQKIIEKKQKQEKSAHEAQPDESDVRESHEAQPDESDVRESHEAQPDESDVHDKQVGQYQEGKKPKKKTIKLIKKKTSSGSK